jgi:hypothetical protein
MCLEIEYAEVGMFTFVNRPSALLPERLNAEVGIFGLLFPVFGPNFTCGEVEHRFGFTEPRVLSKGG